MLRLRIESLRGIFFFAPLIFNNDIEITATMQMTNTENSVISQKLNHIPI